MTNSAEECDVLVIGGGPGGSTAAALLAERGHDVVLLEAASHPRFHIGESLLPRNLGILRRLGLVDAVAALGVYKPGAEFVSDATGQRVSFDFSRSRNPAFTFAYQVPRAAFDALLFDHAKTKGARAFEHTRAVDIEFAPSPGARAKITVRDAAGERVIAPRYVLDASGREALIARKLGMVRADKRNNTAAVHAHYRGVETRDGEMAGYITIHLAEDGWFWLIPLPDGVMSVGFVGTQAAFRAKGAGMDGFFARRIADSPTVAARMIAAERVSDVHATGNYSYRAKTASGEGWMMVGDAFAFIDPMFSSGVLLAMTGGELAADVAAAALRDPARARVLARKAERELCKGMDNLSWLIHRINDPVLREMFMAPRNTLGMRDGIITLAAGNLTLDWRAKAPVLALKLVYHAMHLARRFGWRPDPPAAVARTA